MWIQSFSEITSTNKRDTATVARSFNPLRGNRSVEMLSSDSTAKKRGLNRETISFLFCHFLSYYMLRVWRWRNNPCASQRVKNRKGRSLDLTERTSVRATLFRFAARNRCWKMRRLVKPEQIYRHARTSVALNGRSIRSNRVGCKRRLIRRRFRLGSTSMFSS